MNWAKEALDAKKAMREACELIEAKQYRKAMDRLHDASESEYRLRMIVANLTVEQEAGEGKDESSAV